MSVTTVSNILGLLTLLGDAGIIVVIIIFLGSATSPMFANVLTRLKNLARTYALPGAFGAALSGMFFSLYYSEIANLQPCNLCWYQRIFLYPQAFLLGYAWYRNDASIAKYSILLSVPGAAIAAMHYYEQMTASVLIPCSTSSFAVSCTEKSFTLFGYITMPMMSLTAFGLILTAMILLQSSHKKISESEVL